MEDAFRLADGGNTYNPALLTLRSRGFSLELQTYEDHNRWVARKDGRTFSAADPLALLGLVAVWEHFGDDWNHQEPSVLDELYS
jgi:hypothetical protein